MATGDARPVSAESGVGKRRDLHEVFIQNVSHHLRTPLHIVQGYVDLLGNGDLGKLDAEQEQAITLIANRASELRNIVERIEILLSIEAGLNVETTIAVDEAITKAIERRRASADQADLTLNVEIAPNLPVIQGDPLHLTHAIDCLLENAIKFTPKGGNIVVRGRSENETIAIEVVDTGIGITQQELDRVFSGFYQIDGSTTRKYEGIGLGLTLVQAVISEEHNGWIEASSELGKGSRFTIHLPVRCEPVRMVEPQYKRKRSSRRILIVDDEEHVALALRDGLEGMPNSRIVSTTSGEKALRLFEQEPFDLLITDYKMPGTNGTTLAVRFRQLYPEVPVIMITAYGNAPLRDRETSQAVDQILDKPIRLSEIRDIVREALRASRNGNND